MDPNNIDNGAQLTGDHVGSPSFGERASKRLKTSPAGNDSAPPDDDAHAKQLTLPPEVWANVMQFLPFGDIVSCGAVSRSLLRETMPLLTLLRIDTASQMHLGVASRFRDVTDIHINSLLTEELIDAGGDEVRDIEVDIETRIKCIPFISRFLPTLERLHFGGKNEDGEDVEGFAPADGYFFEGEDMYPNDGPWASMKAFIDMLSGAYGVVLFSSRLKISGLTCPNNCNAMFGGGTCTTCQRACKSFPLESVVAFESKCSSISNARSGRPYGLDVCLTVAEVERIIESRPGGKELLRSDARLLRLLGSGRRWELKSDDNDSRTLLIVKYTQAQLAEIKRVIQFAELDVKSLSPQKVYEAVSKSFLGGRSSSLPQKNQCYLSDESLLFLKDEVGLFIDTGRLCGSSSDILPYLKPIVHVLVEYFDEEGPMFYQYEAILSDCFKLLRRLLEFEDDVTIEEVNDAIPCLAKGLGLRKTIKMEAAISLGIIVAKGTDEQRKMIFGAGVIPKFIRLLKSSEDSITNIALLGLVDILVGEKKDHVDAMVEAGGIPKLVELLHSSDDVRVKGSQSLLVIAADDHIQKVIDAKAHDGLFRIILSDDQVESLPKCSVLLRKIFEVDNPPIQQAIDANLVPRLVQILNTREDETVETNLAFVCISLALGANEDNIESLMRDTGLLPLLVSLQDSSIETVSVEAATCLDHVANIRVSFDAESEEPLAWGEFRVLELFDSDDDSAVSFEEAMEVSDEQVALEEQQAEAANSSIYIYQAESWACEDDREDSPSLLGIPQGLLQTILIYATKTQAEVNALATVCRQFSTIVETYDNGEDMTGFRFCHPSLGKKPGVRATKSAEGIYNVRKAQGCQKDTYNDIKAVVCDTCEVDGVAYICDDNLVSLAANVMTRMNHFGAAASFRIRGDTVYYLFELLQGYMVKRLEDALLMAVHCGRTEVQEQDFALLPSQKKQSKCNVAEKYHGVDSCSFICSCSLPSRSGIIWRWPENDCRDLLPPDAGRRIIRRLAYKAGIIRLTGAAFEIAEVELLHTLGVLLVEAYESSVEMSKSARFLGPEEALPYRMFPDSIDMFYVPPPPITEPLNNEKIDIDKEKKDPVYTIVPGQISAAAQRRNIEPHVVYCGCGYVSSLSFEDEEIIETNYYYKDHHFESCDNCSELDCKCDSRDDDSNDADGNSVEELNDSFDSGGNDETLTGDVASNPQVHHHDEAAMAALVVAANAPQPARNELDALRAHPRFEELRRSFPERLPFSTDFAS